MLSVRCPECDTSLALDPQTIRNSLGWARCGHCQHVFDAAQMALPTLAPHPSPLPISAPTVEWPSLDLPESEPSVEESHPPASTVREEAHPLNATTTTTEAGSPAQDRDHNRLPKDEIISPEVSFVESQTATPGPVDSPINRNEVGESFEFAPERDPILGTVADDEIHPNPIVQARKSGAFEQLRAAWMWLAIVALLSALLIQLAIAQRDYIVAKWPQTSVVMVPMSHALGLSIDPIQDVRQLHIAHSSVSKSSDQQFQLELELKNEGDLDVRLPQLEVSLLNAEGHIWARRVLPLFTSQTSGNLMQANRRIAAHTYWSMSESDAAQVDGYRLRLVYDKTESIAQLKP